MERSMNGPGAEQALRSERAQGGSGSPSEETAAVLALLFLVIVTAAWWLTALLPPTDTTPAWLQTARAVCFGTQSSGLPNAGGWILLIGEPIGMTAALYFIWGRSLTRGLSRLKAHFPGRVFLGGIGVLVAVGMSAAGVRIANALSADFSASTWTDIDPRPLTGAAPALHLIDHHGRAFNLSRFRGEPVLVTFAFGQCETICPVLVHNAMHIRHEMGGAAPPLVVVTVDPWRDTPLRLPHIAAEWGLDDDAFLLGGEVEDVLEHLGKWDAMGVRDLRTGDIAHAPLTYVVNPEGQLAFATDGSADQLRKALAAMP